MSKVHLFKNREHKFDDKTTEHPCSYYLNRMQCGFECERSDIEKYETINYKEVNCKTCERSLRYKELEELDKQVSEIKEIEGEAMADFKEKTCEDCDNANGEECDIKSRLGFDSVGQCLDHTPKVKYPAFADPLNAHYKTGGIQTVDKIEMVLKHLEGKINTAQASHIYNVLKYFDRCENKGSLEKDLFKSADSICRAITGKFINEVK